MQSARGFCSGLSDRGLMLPVQNGILQYHGGGRFYAGRSADQKRENCKDCRGNLTGERDACDQRWRTVHISRVHWCPQSYWIAEEQTTAQTDASNEETNPITHSYGRLTASTPWTALFIMLWRLESPVWRLAPKVRIPSGDSWLLGITLAKCAWSMFWPIRG